MVSVRITATGAVVFASLSFLTAPVSACDERYIKKCERASAAAVAAAESADATPAAKRKSAGRVQMVVSRHSKHIRFAKRTRAPAFTMKRERGMTLASAEVRAVMPTSESALTRRFRGFINPQPIAQNAFEVWRKPHIVALDLEPPMSAQAAAAAETVAEAPAAVPETPVTPAKQDRAAPKPAQMELASAESKPVTLPELPAVQTKPAMLATANAVPAPAVPQAYVSEAPQTPPADSPASRFSIHQLVLALCGALGAASALRFIVGA
jgi:hypothetical protein